MWNKAALLAAALILALHAFADDQSNSKTPGTDAKTKSNGVIQLKSFQFGASNPREALHRWL